MMRSELAAYLVDTYGAESEHRFAKEPSFQVFRHHGCWKRFAVNMDTPRKNRNLPGEGKTVG